MEILGKDKASKASLRQAANYFTQRNEVLPPCYRWSRLQFGDENADEVHTYALYRDRTHYVGCVMVYSDHCHPYLYGNGSAGALAIVDNSEQSQLHALETGAETIEDEKLN